MSTSASLLCNALIVTRRCRFMNVFSAIEAISLSTNMIVVDIMKISEHEMSARFRCLNHSLSNYPSSQHLLKLAKVIPSRRIRRCYEDAWQLRVRQLVSRNLSLRARLSRWLSAMIKTPFAVELSAATEMHPEVKRRGRVRKDRVCKRQK